MFYTRKNSMLSLMFGEWWIYQFLAFSYKTKIYFTTEMQVPQYFPLLNLKIWLGRWQKIKFIISPTDSKKVIHHGRTQTYMHKKGNKVLKRTYLQNHGGRSDNPTLISTSGFCFASLLDLGVAPFEAFPWPFGPYFSWE